MPRICFAGVHRTNVAIVAIRVVLTTTRIGIQGTLEVGAGGDLARTWRTLSIAHAAARPGDGNELADVEAGDRKA